MACTVTTGTPEGRELGEELAKLDRDAPERGITTETVRWEKLGRGGPAGRYVVTGLSGDMERLEFELIQQADGGLRVAFPPMEELHL